MELRVLVTRLTGSVKVQGVHRLEMALLVPLVQGTAEGWSGDVGVLGGDEHLRKAAGGGDRRRRREGARDRVMVSRTAADRPRLKQSRRMDMLLSNKGMGGAAGAARRLWPSIIAEEGTKCKNTARKPGMTSVCKLEFFFVDNSRKRMYTQVEIRFTIGRRSCEQIGGRDHCG